MSDTYPKIKVAAAQVSPVFLDREASVAKACAAIREAGAAGAKVVAFCEGFLPTHPLWYNFYAASDPLAEQLSTELFKNSVEVPSPATDALCEAAREASINVVMGICEKVAGTTGTLYNTQLFIGEDGSILGKHQKLMPTFTEKLVHAPGDAATLKTFKTSFGRMSGLVCGENGNPLAMFRLIAEGTQVHVASWPPYNTLSVGDPPNHGEGALMFSRMIAFQAKAFVINACSTVDDTLVEGMKLSDDTRDKLRKPGCSGGSSIVGPSGEVLAGPMDGEEGILYADIDLELCVKNKFFHDYSGHYNRPDVFQLQVTHAPARIVVEQN